MWFLDYPPVRDVTAATFRVGTDRGVEDKVVVPTTPASPRAWERLGLRFLGTPVRKAEPADEGVHDVEDAACGMIHIEGGVSLAIEASWSLHCRESSRTLQLFGDQGGLELWPLRLYRTLDGVPVDMVPRVTAEDENAALARHFIDCILRGTPPRGTAAEGTALLRVLESMYAAAEPLRQEV